MSIWYYSVIYHSSVRRISVASEHFYVTGRKTKVIKMRKEISIKEFMTKLNEKGIEHMLFHGGTSELFGVENIKGKKVYLDEGKIVLTDNALTTSGMDWMRYELDKPSFISEIKEAMAKGLNSLNEDVMKDIFKMNRPGRLYFKENIYGCIEIMVGYKELA